MKEKHTFSKYLFMMILGCIFLVVDVHVYSDISYPEDYENSSEVIGEFQYYNIYSNYGATCTYKLIDDSSSTGTVSGSGDTSYESGSSTSDLASALTGSSATVIDQVFYKTVRFDVISDILGFILLIIPSIVLIKRRIKKFIPVLCFGIFGILLKAVIYVLPFVFNGLTLCYIVMLIGIAYLVVNLACISFTVTGLFYMSPGVICRDERRWGRSLWVMVFVMQIVMTFMLWLGSDFDMLRNLGFFFEGCIAVLYIVFMMVMRRNIHYLEMSFNGEKIEI